MKTHLTILTTRNDLVKRYHIDEDGSVKKNIIDPSFKVDSETRYFETIAQQE